MATRWIVGAALLGLTGASALVTACTAPTDLGESCFLVRKDPANPEGSIRLKEREIASGKDFISFGATECEDLVCVRDANAPRGADEQDATGFCSKPCVQTNASACETGDSAVDESDQAFTCRPLILDEATLAAIRQADPEKYKRYFGDTNSPYFCARPE